MRRPAKEPCEGSESPAPDATNAERAPRGGVARKSGAEDAGQRFDLGAADILEALPFYALLVDEHHHILQANSAVRAQLGLDPQTIVGKYCPMVVHGLDAPWHACPLEEAVDTDKAVEREAFDRETGRWAKSGIYPTGRLSDDGGRVYFHTISDITEGKLAEDQLRASREQLRELSRFLESVREEERTRMAREIHDELGQTLTALKIDLSWLRRRLPEDEELLVAKTDSMYELVDDAIQTVKRVSSELRPGALDDLGLADAIEWQTQEFGKLTDIHCEFRASPDGIVLGRDLSTALFRICQEALTNVARHAQATKVSVRLRQQRGRLALTISDNGKGIEERQILDPRAFGLIGMRERARFWGGEVKIGGGRRRGTVVTVAIPLKRREDLHAADSDRG